MSAHIRIEKIQALPAERIAEIEDFVDCIRLREHERALTRDAATMSAPAFAGVWSNPGDHTTMSFEFDAVVLVPFPFTNQTASKAACRRRQQQRLQRRQARRRHNGDHYQVSPKRFWRDLDRPVASGRPLQTLRGQAALCHDRTNALSPPTRHAERRRPGGAPKSYR
jgi:hypothetical protein